MNQPGGPSSTTPLMAAAGGGHLSCTQQLLDCNADAAFNAPSGTTALMAAASGGHTQCVAALIQADAPMDYIDCNGMSAIMLAAAAGHVYTIQCLLKHTAAIAMLSGQVATPQHTTDCMLQFYCCSACLPFASNQNGKRDITPPCNKGTKWTST